MAMTGWYPDPGGAPGRYRYWDGSGWSDQTTDDPAHPPPVTGGRPQPPRPQRTGLAVGISALVLVIVVVSAVLIIRRNDAAGLIDTSPPTSGVTGWNDSSPLPTAPASGSGSARPDDPRACPDGQPEQTALHPEDGRIHGGRLSMPTVAGYSEPAPQYVLSWMDDTTGVEQTTEPGWISLFAVGEVARTARFSDPREAARASMQCAIDTSWYLHFSGRKDIRDERISVDGRPGWILSTEVRVDDPDVEAAGDQLTFVVVDDGRQDALSVWCGMVPLDDLPRLQTDAQVLDQLRIGN